MLLNTKIAKKSSSPGATLLWTNPRPNDPFSATVVALESGYSCYLVEFNDGFIIDTAKSTALITFTETPFYYGASVRSSQQTGYHYARKINYVRDGEISFGTGYYDYSQPYDRDKIPLRIWGIK